MPMNPSLNDMSFSSFGSALTIHKIVSGESDLVPCGANGAGFYEQKKSDGTFDPGYYIRALYEDDRYRLLYRLSFDGIPADMENEMTPEMLTLSKANESMRICFSAADTIRFLGDCKRFELYMSEKEILKYNAAMFLDDRHIGLNTYTRKSIVYALHGTLELDAPWGEHESNTYIRIIAHPDAEGKIELVYKDFRTEFTRDYLTTGFDADVARVKKAVGSFLQNAVPCTSTYEAARDLASYILWNNSVSPNQLLRRNAILADKEWRCEARYIDCMLSLWALMPVQPELAWDQFLLFAEQQDDSGAMPAWIGSYKINDRALRPPMASMPIRAMLARGILNREQMKAAYDVLSREAGFWLTHRDYNGNGIPEYTRFDECGGEGCSAFDRSIWVETPDLTAYLILELQCLGTLSRELGLEDAHWLNASENLLSAFIQNNWEAERRSFVSRDARSHQVCPCESLINHIPLILGKLLPDTIRDGMLNDLLEKEKYLCTAGITSQAQTSAKYDEALTLRGGVWAPWLLMIVYGLQACGFSTAARDIARRFCDNAVRNGFRERYSASGKGLDGHADSATAAVFLILLRDYLEG